MAIVPNSERHKTANFRSFAWVPVTSNSIIISDLCMPITKEMHLISVHFQLNYSLNFRWNEEKNSFSAIFTLSNIRIAYLNKIWITLCAKCVNKVLFKCWNRGICSIYLTFENKYWSVNTFSKHISTSFAKNCVALKAMYVLVHSARV